MESYTLLICRQLYLILAAVAAFGLVLLVVEIRAAEEEATGRSVVSYYNVLLGSRARGKD